MTPQVPVWLEKAAEANPEQGIYDAPDGTFAVFPYARSYFARSINRGEFWAPPVLNVPSITLARHIETVLHETAAYGRTLNDN